MSPLVKIVGVGAHLPPGPEGSRSRTVFTGAQVHVDQDVADQLVAGGVGVLVGESVAAEQAVTTSPAPTALADMSVAQLKALAKESNVPIPAKARTKPAILAVLADAGINTPAPADGTGEGLADDGLPEEIPEELNKLDDDQLAALAVRWSLDIPDGLDRDGVLDFLEEHAPDPEPNQTGENDG